MIIQNALLVPIKIHAFYHVIVHVKPVELMENVLLVKKLENIYKMENAKPVLRSVKNVLEPPLIA